MIKFCVIQNNIRIIIMMIIERKYANRLIECIDCIMGRVTRDVARRRFRSKMVSVIVSKVYSK